MHHDLNLYFKEARTVQAAEMEIDFLFFSCLELLLDKEIPSTLHVHMHFSSYVYNT